MGMLSLPNDMRQVDRAGLDGIRPVGGVGGLMVGPLSAWPGGRSSL